MSNDITGRQRDIIDDMYDDLFSQGYLQKDRDTFRNFFFAPGEQGYKNRKALYDDLHGQGYLEAPTYEDFTQRIGLHAVEPSAGQPTSAGEMVAQNAAPQKEPTVAPTARQQKRVNRNAVPEWRLRKGLQMAGIGSNGQWQSRVSNPGYQKNRQRVANSLKMDQGRRAGIGVDEQTGKVSMQSAPKLTSYTPETIVNQMQSETGGAQGDAAVQRVREQMPEHYAWLQERMGDDADRYIMNLAFNKAYGDDPDNFVGRIMQKYGQGDAAEQAWQEAEEAARKEFREYLDERNKPSFSNIMQDMAGASNVTGGLGQNNVEGGIEAFAAHMKYHDLKRMSDAAWNRLGKQNQQAIIGEIQQAIRGFYPNATEGELWDKASDMARQYSDRGVYDYAVAMNTPKSATEYFFKKAGLGTTFGAMMESAARVKAGSIGDMQARDEAWQRYEKDHKGAGITGTVAGMAIDPLTYASGGIGSLAAKGFMWLGGKALGTAAMRRFATTLGGRMIAGAVGGSANLGTFMGGSEAFEQARHGGYVNPNTGVITDYNLGAVAGRFGHGALMGLGTGVVAPAIGNVSDKLIRATESTAGKLGIRVGELGISTVAEGTIFSIPEWIEGKRDPMDVWTDNMAMMAGFKVGGLIKSARQRIEELRDKENPQNMAERNHNRMGFQDRLRKMLDGRPDLALSKDEKAELERRGYTDLTELVEGYKDYSETKKQQKKYFEDAKAQGLTNEAARQEEESKSGGIPWNRFTELMEDGSVSEAARAKMYYYLTGQLLPMSTVSGSNFVEHKDANGKVTGYTVESMGANGVITSKTFRSKKAATAELNRIDRQAELNTIDIGERFYNEKYDSQRMYEACRRMSERTGVPVNSLYNMMKMDAESMSDVEARWAEEVMKEYESLSDETFAAEDGSLMNVDGTEVKGLSAIREEIGYRFGVDLDKAIGKDRSARSKAEQQAVEEYINRLYEEMERESQEPAAEETIQDRLEMSNRTGYYTPDEGQQDIKRRYDVARQRLRDLGFNDYQIEYLEGLDKQGILDELGDMEGREDAAAEAVREFLDARAAYEGMVDRVQDDIDSEVQTSDEMVDQQTNKKTGMTQRATLKGGGEVFIIDGEVNVVNGEIDLASSSSDLVVFNPATGKPDMISINDLESADEPIPADQVKQENADAIRETKATEASNRIEGVLPFQPGDRYEVLVDESPVEVTVIEDQGENVVVQFAGSAEPTVMTKSMIQDAANALRDVQIAEQAAELGSDDGEVPLQSSDTGNPPAVEEEPVIEESVDEDAMPMDGEEVDWFATTPERAHRFLYEEAGLSPEEADAVVVNSIRDAEKELEKVNKKAPKPGNASQLNKYRAEKKDHDQQVVAAQAAVDYWKGVKAIRDQQQMDAVRAQAEERAARDAAERQAAIEAEQQYQAEQSAKKREEAERGPFTVGTTVTDKWNSAPKVDGVRDQITLADGTTIAGHYVLVEAGAATPSHDPANGWKASEGFPFNENGGTVNDRDYERDQAAQDITRRMSETYDSRAAQSVPVVTNDGVVLSGNGRTIAGDLAAQAGTDGAYIDYIKEFGGKYGFSAEQVGAMQHPRVLFIPDESMFYTPETFAMFNAQEMKGQNLTETAVKLGKTVQNSTFNDVVGLINRFDTMTNFYADDAASAQAINMLLQSGVINPMQFAQMFDGDKVSGQGKEMLENLLLGKAFEGNPDAIRQLTEMPSVRQQIVSSLAEIANNSALSDYSLEDAIAQAIGLVYQARKGGIKQGDTVTNYARQLNLFPSETGATVADYRNAMVLLLGDILNGKTKNTLKYILTLYNRNAADAASGQMDLFSGAVKAPETILKETVDFINQSSKNELKQEIKQATSERKSAAEPVGEAERGEPSEVADERSEAGRGTDAAVADAASQTDTNPTDGQKEAGNYKKGHVKVYDFDVTIEQPKGSVRSGVDADGKEWSQEMHNTYGYIRGTEGVDGDHIDVFLSDHLDDWNQLVFVVDQVNKDGSFDEHKVMLGFNSTKEAEEAYLSNYEEGWTGLGNITVINYFDFKDWINSSHRKTKPFAEYKIALEKAILEEDESEAPVAPVAENEMQPVEVEQPAVEPVQSAGTVDQADRWEPAEANITERGRNNQYGVYLEVGNTVSFYIDGTIHHGDIIDFDGDETFTIREWISKRNGEFKDVKRTAWQIPRLYGKQKNKAADVEAGGAVVDQLQKMGVDINTDLGEYRTTLSEAKKDNSEAGTIKYMKTSDGTTYGFTYRGKIHIDPRKINADLPLHEYGHLWGEAVRKLAPDTWKQIVDVLKSDADTWNFLKARKPELTTDDAIADEMIAEFSGKNGEQRLKDELERMSQSNADYKTRWGNIFKNIVKAIQDFWKSVGDFLHIDYKTPQQIYDQVLKDFASGMNPRERVERYLKERDADFVDAVNRGDNATATRLFNEALAEEVGNGMTPFISVGGYGGKLRDLARKVKNGNEAAIEEVADIMAPIIPKNAVLIPAPSHTGRATYMLDIANAIAKRTGSDVADILVGPERARQYDQKKETGKPIASKDLGVTVNGEIPEGNVPVVLDNVVATGNTAEACVQALGKGIVCSLAKATDQYNHVASLKSANVVVRDSKGNVIPLSKRFDLSQSKRLGNIQFSKAEVETEPVSEQEAAVRDALIDVMRDAGIEVITDTDEGQRVLEEYNNIKKSDITTEGGDIKLHRTWHGSGNDFDKFDHSHMGEGEGTQYYGWGTYVTEVEEIGRRYAEGSAKKHPYLNIAKRRRNVAQDNYLNSYNAASTCRGDIVGYEDRIALNQKSIEHLKKEREVLVKKHGEDSAEVKNWDFLGQETLSDFRIEVAADQTRLANTCAYLQNLEEALPGLKSEYEAAIAEVQRLESMSERFLYDVEIPGMDEAYYLGYTERMGDQKDALDAVDNELTAHGWHRQEIDSRVVFTKDDKQIVLTPNQTGADLYEELQIGLGSPRAASEFLHDCGLTGIEYPANYQSGGNKMGAKNFVIFDESDLNIVNKIKFFRTEDGEAFGFIKDGRIYIDPRIATSDTPIHEYGHLWCEALRLANPKAWARLRDVILKEKDVLEHVKKLYPNLEGDDLVEEVFNHYSGRRGRERLEREQEEMLKQADGVLNKAKIYSMFAKIKSALRRFWQMSRDLFAGKTESLDKRTAEDFADMMLNDLLNGVDPRKEVKRAQARTLMGVHNITEEKLRSALKLGGLANPSMAVIDTSVSGFDSFGDISLIPDADLIASSTGRNAGTWGADAYSPRFPQTHRRLGKGGDKKLNQWIKSLEQQGMRKEMSFNLSEQFNDYYNSFNIRDNALVYPFLFEKGLTDEVDYYTHKNVDTRLEDDLREANGDQFVLLKRFDEDDEYKKKITDIIVGDEVKNISKKDGESFQEFRDRRREWAKQIRAGLTEDNGYVSRYLAEDLLIAQARAYRENGKFSESRTHTNAEQYINDHGLQEEYQRYFDDKMQELGAETQVYAGSDRNGRSKFKPANLDEISRQMKKQGRAGGEGGIFEDSPGAIRAKLLNPMKTLDQIRKEKGRIVNHEEFEQAREQYQDELRSYADTYARGSAGALADIITSSNMAATAKRYNIDLDADAIADLNEFKGRIRQLPTEYFETKFERPVMLEEFRKVVVPDDLPLDLYGALDRAGLEIVEYKSGDKEDRRRVMLATTKEAPGIRFHFVGEKGAANADKADSGKRMSNRDIAEQMEQAGKDAINIKLATGWERGKDGKWRYEIMDFDDVDVIGNMEWMERHPDVKRARQLLHKLNAHLFGMGEPLTQAETEEYAAIVNSYHGALRFDKPFKNPDRLTLEDYVKDDELFAAYPELRKMPVKFEEFTDEDRGTYRPQRREIAISVKFKFSKDGFRNVLLHEVQHAIQHIEGFASGSSEEVVRTAWENIKGINKTVDRLADSLGYQDWIKTLTPEKLNSADDLKQKGRWFNLMYVFAKDHFDDPDVRDKFIEMLDMANEVIAENKQVTGEGLTPYQAYRGAAGEVEARNVQSRSNMSREERRVSLAENTEDIPRKDQTVWKGPDDEVVVYDIRREPAPKKTGTGYKVFYLKDGKLYPPMVANPGGESTPFGVWLNADEAPVAGLSKTGRRKVKAGGKGTQGGSGTLAHRPGWHLGEIPYALQFNRGEKVDNPLGIRNKKGEIIKVGKYFPNDFVWAEVEYADDVDYQDEAMSYGINKAGKFQHSLAGLPRIPENGSYKYRTNANPATDPWIITGAMRIKQILKPSEVDELVRQAGREPQLREEGAITDEQVEALNTSLQANGPHYDDVPPEGSVAGEAGNIYHTKDGKQVVYKSLFEDVYPDDSLFGKQNERPARQLTEAERIRAMSDEELLRSMGKSNIENGERDFYTEEYDRRHIQEYNAECDRYRQMLEENEVTEEQADDMLVDIIRQWKDNATTAERTILLAQFDTINDYYNEKVQERQDREWEDEENRAIAEYLEEIDDEDLSEDERIEKQRLIDLGYLKPDTDKSSQEEPEAVEPTQPVQPKPGTSKPKNIPTSLRLRPLEEGEQSHVERRYVENNMFDFTGTDKIESAADIAYIFRQLETSSVENVFLVLIKNGKPTIIHVGMGGYTLSVGNIGAGILAASAINPDHVVMLHNHPSGNLTPSAPDRKLHKKVEDIFGADKVRPSIIIDITSGKYAEFTHEPDFDKHGRRSDSIEGEVSHQVYSFSKMVFDKDWDPETAFKVTDSSNIAAFVSSHRLGEHDKVSLIVLDHANHIVGNIFLPWTSLNELKAGDIGKEVSMYIHQMGGTRGVLYGSGVDLSSEKAKAVKAYLQAGDLSLLDCISVENGSYFDRGMLYEPDVEYGYVHDDSVEPEASDEELDAFKEGFNIQDGIARGLARLAQQNKDKVEARRNAVRAISDNIRQLQSAMRKQRNYDRYTVNAIINTAKVMLDSGLFNGLQRSEVKRLLGMVNASVGREDISRQAEKVVDLLQDHQLREWEDLLQKMLRVKASKTNSSGVQVQGALDIEGQRMVQSFKEHMDIVSRSAGRLEDENGDDTDWGRAIKDCEDRMSSNDPVVAKNARQEYDGILLAQQWYNEVVKHDNEIKNLKAELRDAQKEVYDFERIPVTDEDGNIIYRQDGEPRTQLRKRLKPEFGGMDENGNRQPVSDENKAIKKNLKEYERSVQASIRDIKEEQVEGYRRITDAFGQGLNESARRAKEWRDAQVERVNDIHHNINSDIEGRPAKSQPREVSSGLLEPTVNNALLKPIQLPAQTFEKILRYLGKHAYNGEGYLFNRFVPGYMRASNQEFERRYEAMQILDEKVREVFGGQHIRRAGVIPVSVHLWRQLYDLEKDYKRFPPIKVTYWDHGNWVDDELTQGEALYIYMVNKMNDGVMKLRRMGISEITVERIKQHLDPRFIEIADWLQDEFLPSRRELYSEVYERMYGAPMPAVENYVHLVINKGSIDKDEDINNYAFDATNPSTVTGSVIKRTRNSKPIDIHTDVFDLIARDIDDMEHWAAFAEYNRDLNTMRNYGRLRNALRNVKSVEFGGGQQMLKAFDDACAVVAGSYRPALYHSKLDKWAYEVMRMAVGACIALRNFTAFKQTLSIPSFLSEASAEEFAKHTNPFTLIGSVAGKADWEWAEKNLPGFRKRWLSRQMGDPRMLKSELGLSRSRQRIAGWFSRYGMWLNARVDAAAVATGAHAVYETKKKQYLKEGYTPELAESKALADAWVAYNNSQQSTEGPFVSPVQLDKTSLSMLFTMFRTASMSYSRKNQTAARNLKYRLSNLVNDNDYMRKSIDFMKKLYEREGLGEDQAKERAERMYNRGKYKAVWDMVIYSFILTALWNMGKKFLQVSDCDDEQTRNNAWRDILAQTAFGPVEGWVGGDLVSDVGTLLLTGEDVTARNVTKEQPFVTSFSRIVDQFGRDKYEAACMCVNLLTVTLTGVDPSVVTDAFVSIADAFNGDFGAAKEFCIAMYRLNQFPQKQIDEIYIDELGIWGKDIKGTDMGTLARRYADYMRHRNAPYLDWARDDDAVQKANEKYIKKIDTKVKDRLEGRGIEWLEDAYVKADPHLQDLIGKAIKKRVVDVEDEALKDLYDNSTNEATRKAAHDELRKRMGAERDPISGDSEYNKVYNRIKTTDDMEADIELAKAQAAAKAAGDRGKEKAIAGARSKLSGIRKGLGRGNDEQVMETLRNVRQKMLDRFVNGEAAE